MEAVELLHQPFHLKLYRGLSVSGDETDDDLREVFIKEEGDQQVQDDLEEAALLGYRLHEAGVDGKEVAVLLAKRLPAAAARKQVVRRLPAQLQLLLNLVHKARPKQTCRHLLHIVH